MSFIADDFLLTNKTAVRLYHDYAKVMPIFDYHCHISPKDIAENRRFENLTQLWLAGDHYKWRLMRAAGVEERFITGNASDEEKFLAWMKTIPQAVRNPVYHWSYLELARYFGISDTPLTEASAHTVYALANALINSEEFSARNLIKRMNVKLLCTTDDPTDDLRYHKKIRDDGFEVKVLPAFRPDRAHAVESPARFNEWVNRLAYASDQEINNYEAFIAAIKKRHDFFHAQGCRLSDHGLEMPYVEDFTLSEIAEIFLTVRRGANLSDLQIAKFKSALMVELARLDAERGWVHQLHLGALRNVNSRMGKILGPDTGYDAIGDFALARGLARFMDRLNQMEILPKMVLYSINPKDNEVLATIAGCFQDGGIPGKIQFGPAWWFLDQKEGMTNQLNALSNVGLLSRFIGMTTDSRSLLSYPRHEYFRRILCNLIGVDMERGEIFAGLETMGSMVQDICFHNASRYFGYS